VIPDLFKIDFKNMLIDYTTHLTIVCIKLLFCVRSIDHDYMGCQSSIFLGHPNHDKIESYMVITTRYEI